MSEHDSPRWNIIRSALRSMKKSEIHPCNPQDNSQLITIALVDSARLEFPLPSSSSTGTNKEGESSENPVATETLTVPPRSCPHFPYKDDSFASSLSPPFARFLRGILRRIPRYPAAPSNITRFLGRCAVATIVTG